MKKLYLKRFLTVFMAACLLVTALSVTAAAADPCVIGNNGYATLQDAVAAAAEGDIITLADGTYTMPNSVANKTITITGGKGAVIEMLNAVGANDSTIAFDGVTVKFDNDNYEGLQHATKVTYTDCTHIGTQFLYAPQVDFTGCTFEMYDAVTEYAVWTYGATDVTFSDCVFNTNGKAILVYNESTTNDFVADITLTDCTFNSNGTYNDKAAVELGQSPYGTNSYNLAFSNCTADTFVENPKGTPTGSKLWGNKNEIPNDYCTVEITESDPILPMIPILDALPYVDAEGHWAEDAIRYVWYYGWMGGTSADTFSPDAATSRGMLMTVLARMDGVNTAGAVWYEAGLNWAVSQGISDGSDPNGLITREQLVTMLYRRAGSPALQGDLSRFADAGSVSAYARDAMSWAVAQGLISGIGDRLEPQGATTRAQLATILMRLG